MTATAKASVAVKTGVTENQYGQTLGFYLGT